MTPSIARLLRHKTNSILIQLFRYGLVGGVAFVVDLAVLVALTELAGWHYLASATLAFGLGVATNYFMSVLWVFPERTVRSRTAEFVAFLLLGVFGLGINQLTLFLLTGLAGVHYVASKVVATGLTFVWNFASRKILLFTRPAPALLPAEVPTPAPTEPVTV